MKAILTFSAALAGLAIFVATACETAVSKPAPAQTSQAAAPQFGGYASQVEWGAHLVTITGCDDCHSPKAMTAQGPAPDMSRRLSGHPADGTLPSFERKTPQSMGWTITNEHLTAWQGAWGTSFSANLTPDESGIGSWSEEQFINALRKGKIKGLDSSRSMLPPMPWPNCAHMTDDELKAIFAYLKTLPPIKNVVPAPIPPDAAKS